MNLRCIRYGVSMLVCYCYTLHLCAQSENIQFDHLTHKDGLIQSPVPSMLQDKKGYIWIANWSGLTRYDGSTFRNFRQSDTTNTALSHNRVNKVLLDRRGNLWVGTSGGLSLYNERTEQFRHVGMLPGKGGGNYIATLQEDGDGKIWASTFKGLKFVNDSEDSLVTVSHWKSHEPELFEGVSFSLLLDAEKTIWVGIRQGVKRFDPRTKRILPLPKALSESVAFNSSKIVVIRQDAVGDMWFGTEEHGLFRYDARAEKCTRYLNDDRNPNSLPSNWINDILIKDAKLWIATRNGLAILEADRKTFTNYHHDSADLKSLNDDSVWSLMLDGTGNVWIGTYAGGLNIYYPGISNFTAIGERVGNNLGLSKAVANAIAEDGDGGLWIGTFGGGLNYIDRKKGIAKYYTLRDVVNNKLGHEVKAIAQDKTGKLWLGTIDGLCTFDVKSEKIQYIDLKVVSAKTGTKLVNALLIDEEGVWVGTNGGGLRFVTFNGEVSRSYLNSPTQSDGLSDNYINAILKDNGVLWIATQNGLNRLDLSTGKFVVYRRRSSAGITNNNVLTLYKDVNNRLWLGTDGGGLNCFDPQTGNVFAIRASSGLADNVVTAIMEDLQSNLWVSTNNGLSRISFAGPGFPSAREQFSIVNFSADDGLAGNQFLNNAKTRTHQGEMLFGGMNGVVSFFPDRIVTNTNIPKVLFTGFAVKNRDAGFGPGTPLDFPINEASDITLAYDDNDIAIKFSALNFIHPAQNQYAYKMEGLPRSDEWIAIGNQKEVAFVNLEPGRYVFRVKASNNDGVWNNEGRTLTITILPPIWRTWWAYLIYVVVTVAIAYKIIQFFRIRAKLERDLYNEHLQNERQQEFYKMKLDFFTNISHEIRTPLTLILGPVENLDRKTRDDSFLNRQVLQIRNNAERLLRLIGELMDFRKAETGNMVLYLQRENIVPFLKEIFLSFETLATQRNIAYRFINECEAVFLPVDKGQMEKVFFNLLSNAFKFTSDGGKIEVSLSHDQQLATIRITDNGKGIPAEFQDKLFTNFYQVQPDPSKPGTGVGLALSKSIVQLHKGTIEIESTAATANQDGKTTFTVRLPLEASPSDNVKLIPGDGDHRHLENIAQTEIESPDRIQALPADRKYTVLLVEDNDELRNFVAESLSDYQIIPCMNGADGFEKAVEEIPDLVISDVMMPVMNGIDLCRKLKSDDRTSHIPVILLTALANHIHQVNGLKTGADVYITKPFSTRLLELNVFNLLSSRELMRRKFAQQIVLQPLNVEIPSTDEAFMKKLMKVIEDNMENVDFGVVELGEEVGMSKTVLYKKLVALTDLSPADFIKSIRLKKAALLLQQNSFTISEVAMRVGFNDPKYFSKEFKKFHGKSPTEMMAV